MTILPRGWVSAGHDPDSGIHVRNSAIPGRVTIMDAASDGHLTYLRADHWRDWLRLVASGAYEPDPDHLAGYVRLNVADPYPLGYRPRAVRTTHAAWQQFVSGTRDGVFDELPPYMPAESQHDAIQLAARRNRIMPRRGW